MRSSTDICGGGLWGRLRTSKLWPTLRRIEFLRSGLYLAIELRRSWQEPKACARDQVDNDLSRRLDPWSYETSPVEQKRFRQQTFILDAARNGKPFRRGLEIGCAEGLYTEVLAQRCDTLLVLDISPTALSRRPKETLAENVRFDSIDLRTGTIPGKYDLIVVAGVLEYFSRPSTMARVREKLVAALEPEGCLMVETTRSTSVIGIRGGGVASSAASDHSFMSQHPSLAIAAQSIEDDFAITLFRSPTQ